MSQPIIEWDADAWLSDQDVRSVGLAARGLWADLLCVMRKCKPIGFLQHADGKPFANEEIARIAGVRSGNVSTYLKQLEEANVFSRTDDGVIFCRRMARTTASSNGTAEQTEMSIEASHTTDTAGNDPLLTFPVVRGRNAKDEEPSEWALTQEMVDEWTEAFPAVDILLACKQARQWILSKPDRRKTHRGMRAFLTRWLGNDQDRGGGRAKRGGGDSGLPQVRSMFDLKTAAEFLEAAAPSAAEAWETLSSVIDALQVAISPAYGTRSVKQNPHNKALLQGLPEVIRDTLRSVGGATQLIRAETKSKAREQFLRAYTQRVRTESRRAVAGRVGLTSEKPAEIPESRTG